MANVTTKVDLVINRLSQQKYDQLSAAGLLNPNQLYVTSGGADAVLETRLVAGKALSADVTAADISSAIGLDNYLTAVPSDYKTYAQTKQSLSGDGYATQEQLNEKSAVSVDNVKTDVNMVHISLDDYNEKLIGDEILSNELYVISSDYVETYGQQIKNVAEPTDLSDAATKGYVDSNFQPAGNYLTAVPDAYKTYAATLSSLSSTYSLTSHNHSDYVLTSRTVAGQALTEDVTAATISSAIGLSSYLPLTGGTIANPTGETDLWLADGKTNGYAELGVEKGNHYIELYCTSSDSRIEADDCTYRFPNKNGTLARQEDLNYALSTAVGVLSSGSYVYDATDRTMTTIGIDQSATPVIVRLPDAGNGARDFILRIEISSSAAPTFTFTNTAGLDFESEDDDWAVMQPGVNLISFTETKR